MSGTAVPVGVGTRFQYDGEIVEIMSTTAGNDVVLENAARRRIIRVSLRELLMSNRAGVIWDGPGPSSDNLEETATVILAELTEADRKQVLERAAHVREVLTGYRSGTAEFAEAGEPRPEYSPDLPLTTRYAAKAAELGVGYRSIKRWAHGFQQAWRGGLGPSQGASGQQVGWANGSGGRRRRWRQWWSIPVSRKPSRTMVTGRANARVAARFGRGGVNVPSRATAFRVLDALDRWHPTFRLSTKRNQDVAERPTRFTGSCGRRGPLGRGGRQV